MSASTYDGELPPPQLHEVSDGVFAYIQPDGSWWINNAGLLTGQRSAVSVDACATERRTRAYLEAIRGVTDRPVRTLINTHHHGDHTHGNYLFDVTVVAHEQTRVELLKAGVWKEQPYWTEFDIGNVVLAPPTLTYTDRVTVWVDDLACEVRHVGTPAHTTNDSVVWLPERSVLFTGDLLFKGGTPFVVMGSVAGSIDALENVVRPLGAATIVPGHGPVCGAEVIEDVLGYLRFVTATARRGFDAGLSPLETARETDLGEYAGWLDSERLVGNLHRAFAELRGAVPGAAMDVPAALSDMVAYNGGRRLTCRA